jgi:ABC-type multidrug transport system ATPase subunit
MHLRLTGHDGTMSDNTFSAAVIRLGRDPECECPFDPVAYPMVSTRHAKIERTPTGYVLTSLSQTNKTLVNGQPVEGSVPVSAGDRIRLGLTGPTIEIVAVAPGAPRAETNPEPGRQLDGTVQAGPMHLALHRGSVGAERMPISNGGVIGREASQAEFVLAHPHVSRRHARLVVVGGHVLVMDLGSANGTFVNGRRLTHRVALKPGDRLDIGPFSLSFDGEALISRSRSNNIELVARKLRRVVKDRTTGKPLTLLEDVSLVVHPHEFVCLLGPSGSGKSTLLAMLSGRNPPDQGTVSVNGQGLYENFAALKQDIAVVPQKDVLHDSLTVGAALRYTAELRLPEDTGSEEIAASVQDILQVVGLTQRQGTFIRHLSGGQVKRASLANELMARPSLLFLDEVTSGLDEQTDREMMELFRQVADGGKTVVCITHSLANVEDTCHLVVILSDGGRLAFVGTPGEAKSYFGVTRLGDVYRELAERKPEEWQAAFQASALHTRYIRDRLPEGSDEEKGSEAVPKERTRVDPLRQAWILIRRYVAIWRGDLTALGTMIGQALLVAVLLGAVFGRLGGVANPVERAQRTVNLLFLLNVACFWFGCNNAAKELVKERVIYSRERDFNLRIDSYYASKFAVLVLIGLLQVGILLGITRWWCGLPGAAMGQWVILATLTVAGTALGLLISALAKTEEVAVALVPIAVMPQIILAGIIAPLSGPAEWLARTLITTHRGSRALDSLLPADDLAALQLERPECWSEIGVIGLHVMAFASVTLCVLSWQGRATRK